MSMRKVPSLNLNDYTSHDMSVRRKFAKDLYNSFQEYGFVVLNNHTIPQELLEEAYALQKKIFDLPVEAKMKYYLNNGGQRGYTPYGTENAKGVSVKDLKEFWHVGRELAEGNPLRDEYPQNVWPSEIVEFQPMFRKIFDELDRAGDLLLEALGESLEVSPGFFKEMVRDGNSVLRLLHYPKIPEGTDPRCIRAAQHTDIDLATILMASKGSGLQLLDKNGEWLDIKSDPNSLIVNAGDMLELITNGHIKSTVHRVVNPEVNESRYSAPIFLHPRNDVLLECLPKFQGEEQKYTPITAGDFLKQRLKEIGLIK